MKRRRTMLPLSIALTLLLMNLSLLTLQAEEKSEKPGSSEEHVCTVCATNGNPMTVDNLDLWSMCQGKRHYFCNEGCKVKFDAAPEGFMPPVLPRPLPEFTLEDLKGTEARLSKYRGKVLLLDFWATWCKPCIDAIPELKRLHEEFGKDEKFAVIGISVDVGKNARKKVAKFIKKQKIPYPMLHDAKEGQASLALKVMAIPAMFLIDQEGQIVAQWTGKIDKGEVKTKVVEFLSQKK